MYLSPSAEPFQPIEFAIFNNGVPSSVYYGGHPEHDVVQHIPDEAIEELFPPSAGEAAEMEAAEDFVETMAWLSYLDECDEAARFSFAGYGKRWAARRKAGLIGKPHPARSHHHRDTHSHSSGGSSDGGMLSSSDGEMSLVPYVPRIFEAKPRRVENRMFGVGNIPKNSRSMRGHRVPIHQPRKHY